MFTPTSSSTTPRARICFGPCYADDGSASSVIPTTCHCGATYDVGRSKQWNRILGVYLVYIQRGQAVSHSTVVRNPHEYLQVNGLLLVNKFLCATGPKTNRATVRCALHMQVFVLLCCGLVYFEPRRPHGQLGDLDWMGSGFADLSRATVRSIHSRVFTTSSQT